MVLRDDISRWFDEGQNSGAKWMLIAFDDLDQREYATYAFSDTEARAMENSPRESETILEIYDLRQPKDAQIEMLRCHALERLDKASHDTSPFRLAPMSPTTPQSAHRRIRSKTRGGGSKMEEGEGISDPPANEYIYPSFSLSHIKKKWLFHVEEYLSPVGDPGSANALHGVLGGLMNLYCLEGEQWSFAREKIEVGLVKSTADCGNASVSMGLASLYFRERDEGVVALINCATAVRFQLYVKSNGTISCVLDQHQITKASFSGLRIGSYHPRKEQPLAVLKTELKQCFANAPWLNPKLVSKLLKPFNLQRDITSDAIVTFAFVTGDLRNHWEKVEDGKDAEEIETTVNSLMDSLLGACQVPPLPGLKPSFFLTQDEEGQVELEGARVMYQQYSIATGYALEPIACLSVGRTSAFWTLLSADAPDDHRRSERIIIPFGMDDDDFGAKLATALTRAYKGNTGGLSMVVKSVTKRGNLPLIALKSGCLQSLDDVTQDEKSKLSGRERRKALVDRVGAEFCPQYHPLVDTPATEHICTHCDQPIGEGMRSCRVCDYDCCYECRSRGFNGQLKTPIPVFVRRLRNPKWKEYDLNTLSLSVLCASMAGFLSEEGDTTLPQFVKILMRGRPVTELSCVTAGSVLTFLTGPEYKNSREECPPATRAVTTILQACLLPNGLSSATLSTTQWREFVAYAHWQISHNTKRQWGESEHTTCLYALAWCYLKGKVVKQNKTESHRLFLQAANQGNPNALYFMGSYFVGGATGDQERGAKGYRLLDLAAGVGVLEARFQMGRCWDEGIGVSKSEKDAVDNYRIAAEKGHSGAQLMMGVAFLNAKGVNQDTKEAVKWLHLAAAQDEPMASKILTTLKSPIVKSSTSRSRALGDDGSTGGANSRESSASRDGSNNGKDNLTNKDKSHARGSSLGTPAPPPPPKLARDSSQKKIDDPKLRSNSVKGPDEAKTFLRMDSGKKVEPKKSEDRFLKREDSAKASDSFMRAFSGAFQDKAKDKDRESSLTERSRSPGGRGGCLVTGCREDHKKHFCRFCKNENSSHFSSVCPKKPK